MAKTTQKPSAENMGENTENNNNSSEKEVTVLNRHIEGTPFMMRWEKEKGYSYGMAGIMISKWHDTEENMMEDLKEITWNKVIAVATIVIDATMKMKELQEKANNKTYIND